MYVKNNRIGPSIKNGAVLSSPSRLSVTFLINKIFSPFFFQFECTSRYFLLSTIVIHRLYIVIRRKRKEDASKVYTWFDACGFKTISTELIMSLET